MLKREGSRAPAGPDGEGSSDFCIVDTPRERRLSHVERLTLVGGAELARAIERMSRQLSQRPALSAFENLDTLDLFLARSFYYANHYREQPHRFFPHPPPPQDVRETRIHGLGDGEIIDLEFTSGYVPQHPAFLATYAREEENQTVHARMWRHHTAARSTIIAVHGWSMGDQRANSLAFLPGLFYQFGIDILLVELPYHGHRRPAAVTSKFLFPGTDLLRTNEGIGQVISDLRQLRMHLERSGAVNIGSMGLSLGGYCTSLWTALDSLAFSVPIVPLVSMADLGWSFLRERHSAEVLRKVGLTRSALRDVFAVHSPLSYPPVRDPESILLVGARHDTVIPPAHLKALWHHWGEPPIVWRNGGHDAHCRDQEAFDTIVRFLSRRGFAKVE